MHRFPRNLITEWRRLGLPVSGSTFIAAVSGGADSVALFLALNELLRQKKLSIHLVIAHFDHGLRSNESRQDAEFVRSLAAASGNEFVLGKGQVSRRGNLEQNARRARYRFLLETAISREAFAVLTAHTINDQAETFLINLIRGSGPDGLAAMPLIRPFGSAEFPEVSANKAASSVLLIRPMLSWAKREETEKFCREMNIDYRRDTMNEDPAFVRVRVRRTIIPLLAEINPKIIETLSRTAELIGRTTTKPLPGISQPNDAIGETEIGETEAGASSLSLKMLRSLPKSRLTALLRHWLKVNRGSLRGISSRHIEAIERLIESQKSGKIVEIPGRIRIIKGKGRLVYEQDRVEI